VFALAGPAVATAVDMQRALQRRLWFDDVAVRVRIGIHSGSPTRAAPNYIGVAVNTSARVCGAAHGGQIVVSEATRAAARGSMPDGVRLRVLGEFRLRGLAEPVSLFQVLARGLPAKFPPLRAYARA
jgi:class 3 adenylate cyclase